MFQLWRESVPLPEEEEESREEEEGGGGQGSSGQGSGWCSSLHLTFLLQVLK